MFPGTKLAQTGFVRCQIISKFSLNNSAWALGEENERKWSGGEARIHKITKL